jgi:hypothetical protein
MGAICMYVFKECHIIYPEKENKNKQTKRKQTNKKKLKKKTKKLYDS